MSSIFTGTKGLRHQYAELTAAAVNAATDASNAVPIMVFSQAMRMLFIDNTVNVKLALYLVHPDMDPAVAANRLFWLNIDTQRTLNYNISQAGLTFDPKTQVYVSKAAGAGAASSGTLSIAAWG